jgi:hypothetical protein
VSAHRAGRYWKIYAKHIGETADLSRSAVRPSEFSQHGCFLARIDSPAAKLPPPGKMSLRIGVHRLEKPTKLLCRVYPVRCLPAHPVMKAGG